MALTDVLTKQFHPEWVANVGEWQFMRAAINGQLRGRPGKDNATKPKYGEVKPYARFFHEEDADSYLVKLPYESTKRFNSRIVKAVDGEESAAVLDIYSGHLSRSGYKMPIEGVFDDQMVKLIMSNIDGYSTRFPVFLSEIRKQVMGMGRVFVLVLAYPANHPQAGRPYVRIIPREDMIDWRIDGGQFVFVKYRENYEWYRGGLERMCAERIVTVTAKEYLICMKNDRGEWQVVKNEPNTLGKVPIVDGWMGENKKSIVASIARLQFLVMNNTSILDNKIIMQALNIMKVPWQKDIDSQMQQLNENSYLAFEPSANAVEPGWMAYPAMGLDGDFRFLDWNIKRVNERASLRHREGKQVQSADSAAWDFHDVSAILSTVADVEEEVINGVFSLFGDYLKKPVTDKIYTNNRQFDPDGLSHTLDLLMKAMAFNPDETTTRKIRTHVRDSLGQLGINLTPEELKQSDADLKQTIAQQAKKLLEGIDIKPDEETKEPGVTDATV